MADGLTEGSRVYAPIEVEEVEGENSYWRTIILGGQG